MCQFQRVCVALGGELCGQRRCAVEEWGGGGGVVQLGEKQCTISQEVNIIGNFYLAPLKSIY